MEFGPKKFWQAYSAVDLLRFETIIVIRQQSVVPISIAKNHDLSSFMKCTITIRNGKFCSMEQFNDKKSK